MRKHVVLPLTAIILVGAGALLWARLAEPSVFSLLHPSAGAANRTWPADQCWSWEFPLPDRTAGERIGLRLRQKSSRLTPGTSPTISAFNQAMRPKEAKDSFGTGMIVRSNSNSSGTSGLATVQLIDLAEIGAASIVPEKSLRVLAKLSVGGVETRLLGNATILPSGHFAGRSVRGQGTWANGELYLMSFWVKDEDRLTQYDVLLEQSAD